MTVPVPDTLTVGEIGRTLARLERGLDGIAADLKVQAANYISRAEWETRKEMLDKQIAEIRAESSARRVPWTNVVSAVVAIAALSLTVIQLVT